mmetsp:Transcript_5121/g.11620  ORF Transcript_5121/g.11620 Transcript_5121/m.11620 type:complete len:240 (-) Transcript_5121:203-922(-)
MRIFLHLGGIIGDGIDPVAPILVEPSSASALVVPTAEVRVKELLFVCVSSFEPKVVFVCKSLHGIVEFLLVLVRHGWIELQGPKEARPAGLEVPLDLPCHAGTSKIHSAEHRPGIILATMVHGERHASPSSAASLSRFAMRVDVDWDVAWWHHHRRTRRRLAPAVRNEGVVPLSVQHLRCLDNKSDGAWSLDEHGSSDQLEEVLFMDSGVTASRAKEGVGLSDPLLEQPLLLVWVRHTP